MDGVGASAGSPAFEPQRHEGHKGSLMAGEARQEEIREIHRAYKWFYVLMGIAIALGIGIRAFVIRFSNVKHV